MRPGLWAQGGWRADTVFQLVLHYEDVKFDSSSSGKGEREGEGASWLGGCELLGWNYSNGEA